MLAIFYRIILIQIMIIMIFFGILSYLSLNYTLGNSNRLSSIYKSNEDYSYYVLAGQKWCSHEYQLHGLWPQFSHNDWPSNCKKVSYTEPSGQLLEDMNKYWSSCNDNNDLWKHEWIKHGSCVEQQYGLGENGYFTMAVNLFKQNPDLLTHCSGRDCTIGCFNLDGQLIKCP